MTYQNCPSTFHSYRDKGIAVTKSWLWRVLIVGRREAVGQCALALQNCRSAWLLRQAEWCPPLLGSPEQLCMAPEDKGEEAARPAPPPCSLWCARGGRGQLCGLKEVGHSSSAAFRVCCPVQLPCPLHPKAWGAPEKTTELWPGNIPGFILEGEVFFFFFQLYLFFSFFYG